MVIKKGDKGESVKQLQRMFNVYPDGIFGELTEEAVKEFQKANGLVADGIVGDKTWSKLCESQPVLKRSKRTIKQIIVHCTATKEGKNYTIDNIRQWHKANGWSDIGYHYVIYLDGTIHLGRDVDIAGAHCQGYNTNSIGVVYVGGLDNNNKAKDTRTKEQKEALLNLLKSLKRIYPSAKIYGHNNFTKAKACPCFRADLEYANI